MDIRGALFLPLFAFLPGAAGAQSNTRGWVQLPMETPAAIGSAVRIGEKAPNDILHLSIGIACRDLVGLQNFANSVSNPKSSNYRHFIKPEEVGRRFGISETKVASVSNYLFSQGMKIRLVAKNRLSILADATVAQAEAAFHTTIDDYLVKTPEGSRTTRYAFLTPSSIPTAINRLVTVVGGLENIVRPRPQATLTPDQLRTLYGVAPIYGSSYQGQGRTVAISNWDGYRLSNIPLEYQQFNLPTPPGGAGSNVTVVSIDGQDGNTETYAGEGDIDIQCVLAMAPLCNLIIYDNANQSDYLGVVSQEADDNKADIVTESYGWGQDTPTFIQVHAIHLSMTSQGMTYMCASGDSGADGVPPYPYPDEDPEVLVVGGTSATVDSLGNRTSEVVWNNDIGSGGGGWAPNTDPFNVLPPYQTGNGVPTGIPYRLIPDISLDADPDTGYDIFMGGSMQEGWGGTSCASPTFAGSLADAEQQLIAAGALAKDSAGNQRMGRIQDLLYSFNGDPTVFYDITSGSNGTLPNGNPSNAGPGWDTASGWGAPNLNGLVDKILGLPLPVSFTVSPATVLAGTPATGTVTIDLPAPTAGLVFSLSSDNAIASPPSTVTIAAGATSATFTVNTGATTVSQTANLTATASGVSLTASLAVNPTGLSSMTVSPSSVVGGNASLGTVTLNGVAPAGGYDIALSSSDPSVTVPQHVEVAAGSSFDIFSINTTAVTSITTVTITGSLNGSTVTATVTVTPGALAGVSVSPGSVVGGSQATGTLTMMGTAPAGGIIVNVSSNNGAASVPSTVTIPAGASSATFAIPTTPVSANTVATVSASQGAASFKAQLTVLPAALASVSLSPPSLVGGNSSIGAVKLTGVLAGGAMTVSLSSSSTNATIPASVTIPNGASSATFSVSTSAVSSMVSATITAKQGVNSRNATLTINPPAVSAVSVSPSPVTGGSSSTGTVTLNGPSPAGGTVVALSSSSVSAAVPASVTVAGGATTASFAISTTTVSVEVNATITASLGSSVQSASLSILTPLLLGVSVSPSSLVGGNSAVGTVTLARSAQGGGATVSLISSSPSAAVPSSVTVPAGAMTANFNVSTAGVASTATATITAALSGTNKIATLNIQPASLSGLSIAPSPVAGADTATGTVSLNGLAPAAGVRVTLSSKSADVMTPAAVIVPAGASSASFAVKTKAVTAAVSTTVTAKLAAVSKAATVTVEPAALEGLTLSTDSVVGGSSTPVKGTVALNGLAAGAGDLVKLTSSDTKIVAVPASVRVAGGALSASFVVSHRPVTADETVTITAVYGGVTQTAVLTLTPFQITSLTISPGSVKGGHSASGLVTLNASPGALAGAISVKLSSSLKAVTVPAEAIVAVGKSTGKFTIGTKAVTAASSVTITATVGSSSQQANLTVQ